MTELIADRYCPCGPSEACDLATGAVLPADDVMAARPSREGPLDALLEVLDRGQDGVPRWVVVDAATATRARASGTWAPASSSSVRSASRPRSAGPFR